MFPVYAQHGFSHGLVVNAVFSCQCRYRSAASGKSFASIFDLRVCQLGLGSTFTARRFSGRAAFRNAITHVVRFGATKQMTSAHTGGPVTMMEYVVTGWDLAILQFKGDSVGQHRGAAAQRSDSSIPAMFMRAGPNPAGTQFGAMRGNRTVLIDLRPEAIFKWRDHAIAPLVGPNVLARLACNKALGAVGAFGDGRESAATAMTIPKRDRINRHRCLLLRCQGRTVCTSAAPFSCLNYSTGDTNSGSVRRPNDSYWTVYAANVASYRRAVGQARSEWP